MKYFAIAAFSVFALLLGGCANLESIGRRSNLPEQGSGESRAIHLDAKQRLVFAKGGGGRADDPAIVCAEPSPDAISAIAASAGIGASVPSEGAASAATALQTSAASIGLRTQSITLMRDALYRVCEAYYSGQLSKSQVMLLLARSQDLTATVVAVEQLTGAVVAQQAILSGQASSQSMATLLANKQALEQIGAQLEQNQKAVEAASQAQIAAQSARDNASTAFDTASSRASENPDDTALAENERSAKEDLDRRETDLRIKNADLALKQQQLEDTKKVHAAVAQQLESATTSASASAGGSGSFGTNQSRDNLSDQTAVAISDAVEEIVKRVVGKNYLTDACIAYLTDSANNQSGKFAETCYDLMRQAGVAETRVSLSGFRSSASLEPEPVDRVSRLQAMIGNLPANAAVRLATTPPVRLDESIGIAINGMDPERLRTRDARVARAILKRMLTLGTYDAAELDAWETALRAAIPG